MIRPITSLPASAMLTDSFWREDQVYVGTDGDDAVTGTNGDDQFYPGLGDDAVDGAGGYDTLYLDYSRSNFVGTAGVEINTDTDGSFSGKVGNGGSGTYFVRMEEISYIGGAYNEVFSIDGAGLLAGNQLSIDGAGGRDALKLDYTSLDSVTFEILADGSVNSNYGIYRNFEDITLGVGGGHNEIITGSGNDIIETTAGMSNVTVGDGDDVVSSRGIDTISFGGGNDLWRALYGNVIEKLSFRINGDRAVASNGSSAEGFEAIELYGGRGGNNFVVGGNTSAKVFGGDGNDYLKVDSSSIHSDAVLKSYISSSFDGSLYGGFAYGQQSSPYVQVEYDHIDRIAYRATDGDDQVQVQLAERAHGSITVDGGAGIDELRIGLDENTPDTLLRFIVRSDGSVTTGLGTFVNFEKYYVGVGFMPTKIVFGSGDDEAFTGTGNDIISGGGGADVLRGGSGHDRLSGDRGRDTLIGGDGNDRIDGGGGDDQIFGDNPFGTGGRDFLIGGAGADQFIFTEGHTGTDRRQADVIADFSHRDSDLIDLSAIDADTSSQGIQHFNFIGSAKFDGVAGEIRYEIQDKFTLIMADTNGDKIADLTIKLVGQLDLIAQDFVI